jgi:hypothetical protein
MLFCIMTYFYQYAERRYAERRYAERRGVVCSTVRLG